MNDSTPFESLCERGDVVHDRWLVVANDYRDGRCAIWVSLDEAFAGGVSYDVTAFLDEEDGIVVKLNQYVVGGHQATERPVFLAAVDPDDQRGVYSEVRAMVRHCEEQVIPVNHPAE